MATRDGVPHTRMSAANGVEEALKLLAGRWKLMILFQLFGSEVRRFSELERAIPSISEKMLSQQLRQMDADGTVRHQSASWNDPNVGLPARAYEVMTTPLLVLRVSLRASAVGTAPDAKRRLPVPSRTGNWSR